MFLSAFFPIFAFSVSPITGIKSSPYPSISSGGEYVFFQCVFSGFDQTAIVYNNEQSADNNIQLLHCLFDGIDCESAAFSINCAQINSKFTCNALTNCGNTDKNNGAFYYRTTQRNSVYESPLFEYLTVYNCKCYSKLMNNIGPTSGNNNYFRLSESNITSCFSNHQQYGNLYLGDHTPFITHCSFADNFGCDCIVFIEEAEADYKSEPQGTITYCNFVRNRMLSTNAYKYGVICTQRFQNLLVDYCIIMDNQLPPGRGGDYLVANLASSTYLYVTNSKIQTNYHYYIENTGGEIIIDSTNTVIGNNKPTTYAYTFYATHGCHADYPLNTPEKTKPPPTIAITEISAQTPISTPYHTHAYIQPRYRNKILKKIYIF